MKTLIIHLKTDALGNVSRDIYRIPLADFADRQPRRIDTLLPSQYSPYVSAIFAELSDDLTAINISSEKYGNKAIPVDSEGYAWSSGTIGLSYATCEISIFIANIK